MVKSFWVARLVFLKIHYSESFSLFCSATELAPIWCRRWSTEGARSEMGKSTPCCYRAMAPDIVWLIIWLLCLHRIVKCSFIKLPFGNIHLPILSSFGNICQAKQYFDRILIKEHCWDLPAHVSVVYLTSQMHSNMLSWLSQVPILLHG